MDLNEMRTLNSYLKPHNHELNEKFHQLTCYNVLSVASFSLFFDMIADIEGDIVECGIGRSRSLIILSSLIAATNSNRRLIAYDSFAGFPVPTVEDASIRNPQKGEWSSSPSGEYAYTEDFCRHVLATAEIPLERINLTLVKGYFSETLPFNPSQQIALLNIDGDLYQSYKACLENLFHKVVGGGVIIFDDFQEEGAEQAFPGARLAVKNFFGVREYGTIQQSKYGVFYYRKPFDVYFEGSV